MYPFNRSRNFYASCVDNDEDDVESSTHSDSKNPKPASLSPEEQTFMANVIKLSMPDVRWQERFESIAGEKSLNFMKMSDMHSITNGFRPALTILRIMGFFCGLTKIRGRRNCKDNLIHICLILVSLGIVVFNIHIFRHNVLISLLYNSRFGFLHGATVSNLISGIKPLINAVILVIFIWRVCKHKKMLKLMDTVDFCFRSTFRRSPNIKLYMAVFSFSFILSLTIPFFWRMFELLILNGSFKEEIFSFLVVPLLTAWNVLPLMYYVLCNRIVRFWCRILRKSLKKEHNKRYFSLKFYYEQFLRITALQEAIGNTFNPFILFSLAWSLILLCLTIYFLTQPKSSFTEPITHTQLHNETLRKILNHRFFVNSGWALIQIIVAVLHILIICWTGMTTNEETRKILRAVLAVVPDSNADVDRFQINCFAHKMSTQYMWGMTVWRAFPLERATFFTLVSVIITYSLLLLKLKDNPHISPRCPLLNNTST